jgi:hypothetical protein
MPKSISSVERSFFLLGNNAKTDSNNSAVTCVTRTEFYNVQYPWLSWCLDSKNAYSQFVIFGCVLKWSSFHIWTNFLWWKLARPDLQHPEYPAVPVSRMLLSGKSVVWRSDAIPQGDFRGPNLLRPAWTDHGFSFLGHLWWLMIPHRS